MSFKKLLGCPFYTLNHAIIVSYFNIYIHFLHAKRNTEFIA